MTDIKIESRGILFPFNDPYLTSVYVIFGEHRTYVCDTFCGAGPMETVIRTIREKVPREQFPMVFNSHHHYDHIWGNCAFPHSIIFGHHECRRLVQMLGPKELSEYSEHQRGEVRLIPPFVTFSNETVFHDDEVRFFYSPGHTVDSASCLDLVDKVLFVADNVEAPIPYLSNADFATYDKTLREYLRLDWDYLITGHDAVMTDDSLIRENLEYIENMMTWSVNPRELNERALSRHVVNLIEIAGDITNRDEAGSHYSTILEYIETRDRGVSTDLIARLETIAKIMNQPNNGQQQGFFRP